MWWGHELKAQCLPINPLAVPDWEAHAGLLCVPTAPLHSGQPPGDTVEGLLLPTRVTVAQTSETSCC